MGDMNIDLLQFSSHAKTEEYLENIFTSGFIPLITKPTRITPFSATLIDHIYTNKQLIESSSGIVICDVSDHFGIFSIIKTPHHKYKNNQPVEYRSYSPENTLKFKQLLQNSDFIPVLNDMCPDRACLLYTSPSPRDLSTSRMPSSA